MKLNENYRIENDKYNYILKYEKPTGNINEKSGKEEISREEWYFPRLENALDKFIEQSMKVPTEVVELRNEIKELKSLIKSL